jgi:hypothetical protein
MTEDGKMTRAEVKAIIEEIWGPPPPKPKPKVVVDEAEVIRNADVRVSPDDPNYRKSDEGMVRVRRSDFVTINMEVWEEQMKQKRIDRLRRKALDPARLGIWGPVDEDD